jgi:hypothetical protein
MKGDSGTLLPEGLEHPDHWPKLDAPLSEAIDEPSPFVFLSYAHADHARAALVVGFLKRHGFTVWWDDTLNSGDEWREVIAQKLNQASAVFTLWTDASVASTSVTEEASSAQSAHKLVHARLDDCRLPYGFGETQYGTLIGWDYSSDTPQALRIVAALRAKIAPPSAADQFNRLTRASDVDFAAHDGKMTMGDRPLGVPPPVVDPADLEKRIEAQSFLIDQIKQRVEKENPNLNQDELLNLLDRYDCALRHSPVNWYSKKDAVKALKKLMVDEDARKWWPDTFIRDLDILFERHSEMRPQLQPRQPEPSAPDAIQSAPLAAVPAAFDSQQVVNDMSALAQGDDLASVGDDSVVTFFKDEVTDIKDAQEATAFSEAEQDKKKSWLRRVLSKTAVRISAFVAAVSGLVSAPTAVAVLTNPEAGARVLALAQKLLDKLLLLF